MVGFIFHAYDCKIAQPIGSSLPGRDGSFPASFPGLFGGFAPEGVPDFLPAQQLPVNVGDLLQPLFHLVIVFDPAADLLDLIGGHRAAGSMGLVQGDAQIPGWPMPLATGAFAIRLAAGQVAFHQRAAQDLAERRQKFRQALAATAQGQHGELRQLLSYSHMAVSIITQAWENAIANLASATFPLSH